MATPRRIRAFSATTISAALLLSCTTSTTREDYARATAGYVADVNKLFIVDCLLPGQVRKLGTQLTYVSARRPIRTAAADCEVRGGEYVAYDRANYASALKIWEPQAASGDAQAQLYVGEIYEKGLGRTPDFKAAALWYRKAADQGNRQAQVNLGHLYENGLGVSRDASAAARYYAQASGLEAAGLPFAPAPVRAGYRGAETTTVRDNTQSESAEGQKLRAQLREAHQRILEQQNELRVSQNELEATRRRLAAERSSRATADTNILDREKDLERKESQLRAQQDRLEAIQHQKSETEELQKRLDHAEKQLVTQEQSLLAARRELESMQRAVATEKATPMDSGTANRQRDAELQRKEARLREEQAKVDQAAATLAEDRERMARERSRLAQQRAEADRLRAQLAEAQEELAAARRSAAVEKQPPAPDEATTRQLKEELEQKELRLRREQAKLDETMASFNKERKRITRELEVAGKQAKGDTSPALPKPRDQTRAELLTMERDLADKLEQYQKESSELTALLTRSETVSLEQSRVQIEDMKRRLSEKASEIKSLQARIDAQVTRVADLERAGSATGGTGPRIDILQPVLTLTRGTPTIEVHAGIKEIVGRVSAPAGLKSLDVNENPVSADQAGMFKVPVPSVSATDPLRIVAVDKSGNRADLAIRFAPKVDMPQEITASRPESVGPERIQDLDSGKFFAIVIGNNDYAAYPALKTAASDAKSVDVILRERYGFTTKVLINATRHAIMSALNEINARLTEHDNLLIYYAGHGEIDPKSNSGYWLPTDAEVGNSANWISNQSITEWLSIMPAKHIIVVADSCYSGALSGTAIAKLPERVDESKREKWLRVMNAHKARTVLTSGGVQPVLDQGGSGHSIFANAFLKILRSNRGVLEDYEIYRAVLDEVGSTSARFGITQVPQYAALQHAGHEGSPFLFLPKG